MYWCIGYAACLLTLQLIRYLSPFRRILHTPRKAYFSLRLRRHGKKFALPDPRTWPEPAHEHRCTTEDYGEVCTPHRG